VCSSDLTTEGDKSSRPFSIHPDERIIIRENGEQKIEKIGNLIDRFIPSSDGVKKINEIEALTLDKKTFKNEFKPITHVIKHTEKNTLLEIKTKQGNTIKTTKSHSIFKFENGKIINCEAKKLKRGDLIVSVKKITPKFKDHTFKIKSTKNLKETALHETPDLLWIIGFFSGNGCIVFDENKELKGISISSTKKDILKIVEKKLNSVFPDYHINKGVFSRSIISKQIALLFYEIFNGKHYAHEKFVPNFVFNSKNYNEYIDGYFTADGVKQLLKVRTVSKEMTETLPVLMKYNGFRCLKHEYKSSCWKRPRYQLIFTKSKKSELFDLYPYIHEKCKKYNIDSRRYNQNFFHYRYISSSKLRERTADMNNDFGFEDILIDQILHGDMSTEEVEYIKPIKYNGPVYDISVKDNESFVSNTSILLHNTFPIITFNIDNEFDWNGPNTDLLFEATAKYGPFYFANFMNSGLKKTDIRSLCCRLSLSMSELRNKMGGVFGSGDSTGSVGVVTINLAQLGYLSNDDRELLERLDRLLNLAKDSLEIKRRSITENLNKGLMPYTKRYLGSYNTYFSTIGIIGMNELLLNYMDVGIWDPEGKKFALGIMDHIRSRLIDFQQETGNLYNFEATPAEGTTRRLANLDKKNFPDIIVANEKNWKEGISAYYSNSTSLPVGYTNDLFESLDIEDDFLTKYTGGCVKHIYLGERMPSADSARNLVKTVCTNYKAPYFSLTPSFSICKIHGYIKGAHEKCPIEVTP
jgi:anaerobic ribonucleoside-triphosphate reductase